MVPECQENFFSFAYHCGRRSPEYEFCLKIIIKREQFRARNNLVDLALMNDCDYLLMLDDDMVIPADLFERLAAHDKDVVGALYYQRGGGFHPVIMRQVNAKDGLKGIDFIHHFDLILRQPGLYPVDIIGGGCMLFRTEIFRKLVQPYFWIDGIVGTDVYICNQLRDAGVSIYVDTSIELGHVGDAQIITSRTVPKYSRVLGVVNQELWEDLRDYTGMGEDELESALIQSSAGHAREQMWGKTPRESWEQVRAYYQSCGMQQVLNLASYNLRYDQARDWAVNETERVLKPGATVVDYGAGLGYVSIALAQRHDYHVIALDVEGTPTIDFLRWRVAKHRLEAKVEVRGFDAPVPTSLPDPIDGVFLISVLDHLYDPYGALQWITKAVKPGGFLLCDTYRTRHKDHEPQHLVKFDPETIERDFRRLGWRDAPENPYLFIRE